MRHFIKRAPHSIAILRALQLGDLLCTVPTFRALRRAYPHSQITLIGLPWAAAFAERFSHYLDDFISFPGWPGLPERDTQIAQIPSFLEAVQARHFDLVLQMQGAGTITNPLVTLFGGQLTAGFYLPGQFCPDPARFFPYPEEEHEIRKFLQLAEKLGMPSRGEHLEFPVSPEEQASFERFCFEAGLRPGQYIIIHPGARAVTRRWSPRQFAMVADALAEMGFAIIVTGTEAERDLTCKVVEAMRAPAVDAAGQTDLGTLALLIRHARLLVSNDTGVSHIAAAFETPSVILFSDSDPARWRPLNFQLHRAILNTSNILPQKAVTRVLDEAVTLLREVNTYARQSL